VVTDKLHFVRWRIFEPPCKVNVIASEGELMHDSADVINTYLMHIAASCITQNNCHELGHA